MNTSSADDAAGPQFASFTHKETDAKAIHQQKDDRPLPPREPESSEPHNTLTPSPNNSTDEFRSQAARRSSLPNGTGDGLYYPTGYVPPNTKPLRSCLSNSNLKSMSRTMTAPNLSSMGQRKVSFHNIEIREYERAVGNHPCSTGHTSLTIGWNYNPDHAIVDVESYEKEKSLERSTSSGCLAVPVLQRRRILIEQADATIEQLQAARREIAITRVQRRRTNAKQESAALEKVEEGFQSAKRKIKRLITSGSKANEEKRLWENAQKELRKRTASTTTQSTNNQQDPTSPDEVSRNKSLHRRASSISSEGSLSLPSVAETEVDGSTTNIAATKSFLSASIPPSKTSNDDSWEFNYVDDE